MRAFPPMCVGLAVALSVTLTGCMYEHNFFWESYEPLSRNMGTVQEAKVLVVPFEDQRLWYKTDDYDFAQGNNGFHTHYSYDSHLYTGQTEDIEHKLPDLWAKWFAQELTAVGAAKTVDVGTWDQLATGEWPDLVVTGRIIEDGVTNNFLFWGTLGFITLTVLFGTPQDFLDHQVVVELYAFRPGEPDEKIWTKRVEADATYSMHAVYRPQVWFHAPLEDHSKLAQKMFPEAAGDLAAALRDGLLTQAPSGT